MESFVDSDKQAEPKNPCVNEVLTMAIRGGLCRPRCAFVRMIRERIYLKDKQSRSHYLSNYILFPSNVYNVDIDISIFSYCVSQTHF